MTIRDHDWSGIAFTLFHILIASAQSVALNSWLPGVNVFLVVSLCFSVVTVVFALVGFLRQRDAYAELLGRWHFLLALNVVSASNWLLYFFAVRYLEPSVAVTLTQGVGPVGMTLYALFKREPVSVVTRFCHTVVFFSAAMMCYYVLARHDFASAHDRQETLLGMALAVACSLSITATVLISKHFVVRQVPAAALLSVRFPLLVGICVLALPLQHDLFMTPRVFGAIVLIALVGVCGSMYCLQKGIERASPLSVSTVLALSPLAVCFIQLASARVQFSPPVFGLIVVIVIASIISLVWDAHR